MTRPASILFAGILFILTTLPAAFSAPAASPVPNKVTGQLMADIQAAINRKDTQEALKLANRSVELDPKNPQTYFVRGRIYEILRNHPKAISDYTESIRIEPNAPMAYQLRGAENFRAGNIKESITDFEKFISFDPRTAAEHWQLGISYYYAGRYADGAKQFELHQTVNPQDVENAVWHFLCVARKDDVQKARQGLIPIQSDYRVPMKQVHALFAGKAQPDEVFKAAGQSEDAVFYANLYLGLFYEASGDAGKAREYILKAAERLNANNYMTDVARVHAQLLKKTGK
ncbi:MAG: tetratricopeptide repeat protein [Opitutaceae bacterium]|nr:tetratricopeptide repeat protein [Verrucomicrobiales bacterium]